jgi:DNA-binding NarL/FixJ family response regulator
VRRSGFVPTALIVDDHEIFRSAARELMELEGYTVLGEAGTGEAAVALALELRPQLVLLDVSLPDMSGFEVAERLCAASSPSTVVLVSNRDRGELARRAERTPVLGFIPKEELSAQSLRELLGSAA